MPILKNGSFILEGYLEKDDEKPAITKNVKFTQSRYSPELAPIDVSPTSLSFGAQGGEQIVTVDYKNYKYYGGFNDEGSDDWLKVVINGDGTLTVIASPNNTGIERTGTVYAYATDLDQVETLDQAAFKAIPVTQAGEGGNADYEIANLSFEYNFLLNDVITGDDSWAMDIWWTASFTNICYFDDINIQKKDNIWHFECKSLNTYSNYILTFNLININNGIENSTIVDLSWEHVFNNGDVIMNKSITASGIPFNVENNKFRAFIDSDNVQNFSFSDPEFTYKSHPDNVMTISMSYKKK